MAVSTVVQSRAPVSGTIHDVVFVAELRDLVDSSSSSTAGAANKPAATDASNGPGIAPTERNNTWGRHRLILIHLHTFWGHCDVFTL